MELNQYQKQAMTTCMESSNNLPYMLLNLVGEVGEFSSKIGKLIRKEKAIINSAKVQDSFTVSGTIEENNEIDNELKKEAGDILWQLAGVCSVMGWTLEEVAQMNLDKLQSRQKREVIDGDGDNR